MNWIKFVGDESPVPEAEKVEVRFADGSTIISEARSFNWKNKNIVAYRIT